MNDLDALAAEHLGKAVDSPHGRSAHLIFHDGPMRQTVIALKAGTGLDDHNTPLAASLQVLRGRVRYTGPSGDQEIGAGQLYQVPHEKHGLGALEDSVVLFTTVTET
ncbi:hypothetical protein GCM10010406_23170 [Streptomyces thermolineatus]|uniref:Cupin n=1 Tax=Streptomyces thermolineatus TaxID=44033 RepID=A0ABP5YSS6_9ACTN